MNTDAISVFVTAFGVSAFAGVAALLRSTVELTRKNVASAVANSGILGLGIALLWYSKFQDNIYFLIGMCVVAGLGGMTAIDFVLEAVRRGGVSIKLGKGESISLPGSEAKNDEKEVKL